MASESTMISCRRSFLLLKDVIIVFRLDMKRRFRTYIIVANLSERNILYTLFVSSIVYYITVVPTSSVKNMALICCSVL